jgi:hypothetical protein
MRIFIAGIMQGSLKKRGMGNQNYRELIRQAILEVHPNYEIFDPYSLFPDSVEYDETRARQVLLKMAEEAGNSDLVIAYLPEASMGTALEMVRAYDNNKPIISISPMAKNWVIQSFSRHIFPNIEEFSTWLRNGGIANLFEENV